MSFRYSGYCPIARASQVLGERWTILIMRELVLGTTRFNDFQRALSQISPTLLTKRLNELQDCGLLVRKNMPGQRRVEYHPTAAGLPETATVDADGATTSLRSCNAYPRRAGTTNIA